MKLNKEVCKKCIEKYKEQNIKEDKITWTFDWWKKGMVWCPYSSVFKEDVVVARRLKRYSLFPFKVRKSFPESCPYKLEHLMVGQDDKP